MIALIASWLIARNPAMTLPYARRLAKVGMVAAGVVLLIFAFGLWLHFHDKGVVTADRSAAKAEAVSTAREADEGAHKAAESKSEGIEDGNERAKAAAADSDDPLGDGLRSLRAEKD